MSCFTEYIGGRGSGDLSHQIWASIWGVESRMQCVVSCLTKSGCLFGASPSTMVSGELSHQICDLFGELPHQIHRWKGVWGVVSPNLGVYLVNCIIAFIGGKGSGKLSHQIRVSIWRVASLNTLVEGGLVSCLTKSGCLFGELLHRIHWWKRAL